MPSISNLVQQTTVSAGTGALTLAAVHGRQGFYGAFGGGGTNAFFYFVSHTAQNEWEVGTGHMSDAATLQRDTVIASSSAGAHVNFSAGGKDVVNDIPAQYQVQGPVAAVAASGSYNDLLHAPGTPPGQAKKLVIIGDSITRKNTGGASGTRNGYWSGAGSLAWLQVRLGFPLYCPAGYSENNSNQAIGFNAGKGGDTAAGMAARYAADVLALQPDYIYGMAGTNDITAGDTYANITANLSYLIDTGIAHGATVIWEVITPRTNAVGTNDWTGAAQRQLMQAVNNFLREKANTTRGMILIDPSSRIIDQSSANGNVLAAYSFDGIHPTVSGAFWRGDALVEALQHKFPNPNLGFFNAYDLYDAAANPQGNWLTNGQLSGTGGALGTGASGTVADNWNLSRTAGATVTAAGAKTTKTYGANAVNAQKISVTSGGTGSGMEQVKLRPFSSTITSGISTGDWFQMECRVSADAPVYASGGSLGVQGIYLNLEDLTTDTNGNTTRARCLNNDNSIAGNLPDVAWSGTFRTPPLQLRGTAGLSPSLRVEVDATVALALGVTVSSFKVWKLPAAPFTYPS